MWRESLRCLVYLPLSPLYAVVDAIRTLFLVAFSPEKTGKIQAARVELDRFIITLLTTKKTSRQNTELRVLDGGIGLSDLVRGAFQRFKQSVAAARTGEELANLHFIDTEAARQQLTSEVLQKSTKLQEAHKRGYFREHLKVVDDQVASQLETERIGDVLKAAWIQFQQDVVRVKPEELDALKFEPQATELFINASVGTFRTSCSGELSKEKNEIVRAAGDELNRFITELLSTADTQDTASISFLQERIPLDLRPACVGISVFARAAFERFKKAVAAAKTAEELASIHFVDTEEARRQLTAEVLEKCGKIREAYERGCLDEKEKVAQDLMASVSEKEQAYNELNAVWIVFQKYVVHASLKDLPSLKFEPDAAILLINAAVNSFRTACPVELIPNKIERVRAERTEANRFIREFLTAVETKDRDTSQLFFHDDNPNGPWHACVGIGDFVREAFEQFKWSVSRERIRGEGVRHCFVGTEEARKQLKEEVLQKCAKIKDAFEQRYAGAMAKIIEAETATDQEKKAAFTALNILWEVFQKEVVRAKPGELSFVEFSPPAAALSKR